MISLRHCFVISHIVQNPAADTPNKVTNQSPAATTGLCEKLQNNISIKSFNLPENDWNIAQKNFCANLLTIFCCHMLSCQLQSCHSLPMIATVSYFRLEFYMSFQPGSVSNVLVLSFPLQDLYTRDRDTSLLDWHIWTSIPVVESLSLCSYPHTHSYSQLYIATNSLLSRIECRSIFVAFSVTNKPTTTQLQWWMQSVHCTPASPK